MSAQGQQHRRGSAAARRRPSPRASLRRVGLRDHEAARRGANALVTLQLRQTVHQMKRLRGGNSRAQWAPGRRQYLQRGSPGGLERQGLHGGEGCGKMGYNYGECLRLHVVCLLAPPRTADVVWVHWSR